MNLVVLVPQCFVEPRESLVLGGLVDQDVLTQEVVQRLLVFSHGFKNARLVKRQFSAVVLLQFIAALIIGHSLLEGEEDLKGASIVLCEEQRDRVCDPVQLDA